VRPRPPLAGVAWPRRAAGRTQRAITRSTLIRPVRPLAGLVPLDAVADNRQRLTVFDDEVRLEVRLRRLADPVAAGWYSGDAHLHRTIDDLRTVVLAEDLNVTFPLTYWVTTSASDKNQAAIPPPEPIAVAATHLIWPRNTEYEIFAGAG